MMQDEVTHVLEVASARRATMQRDKLLECLEDLVLIVQLVVFLCANLAHVRGRMARSWPQSAA
jgi:hypothetical protein